MSDQAQASPGGFSFLFRRDEGTISRGTWWRGTLGLLGVLAALSAIWKLLSGFTNEDVAATGHLFNPGVFFAYAYLMAFAFAIFLIAISSYNLSAKRWRARGKTPAFAGLPPLAAFVCGAAHWLQPRVADVMPFWIVIVLDLGLLAIVVWSVFELGWAGQDE